MNMKIIRKIKHALLPWEREKERLRSWVEQRWRNSNKEKGFEECMVNTRPYIWDLREWNGVVVSTRLVLLMLSSFFSFSFFLELSNFDCLFGCWEWSALTFSFAFVYTCVCSRWAEIKMRVHFLLFFSCGPMGIWHLDMFIPRDSCQQCFWLLFLLFG